MGMKSGGLIAGLVGLGILNCAALELYVAPGGDDSNTGTREAPFQSLEKAQAAVRARLPMAGNEGITVWLRGGTYYLGRTLEFGPADSGTAAAPVTYAGYAGEKAVISGAIRLSTDWKPYKDGIYVAPVGRGLKFDMLFADGEVQVMARYPNVDPNVKILDGYAPDALSKERSARWSNPATGFARGLHRAEWGGNSYRITGRKPNGDLQMEWMKDNNRGGGIHKKYRMVENIFEELDAPGEWFYDESAGNLYFQPLEGMDPAKVRFEGASLEELIRIVGTADEKVRHLTFKNLTFTGTHRTLFTREYEGIQRSDWRLVRAGALFIQDAAEVTVEGCTFDRVGGNALFFSAYNRNHLVTNNEFLENGATCVNVVGSTNALRHANTWENHVTEISQIDGKAGPKTEDYPK
uniref:right-handed parallel beta-helix repeat-containing protein n=1 Tax=Pontiella sp. TaxID=2837462 RepID=UPI0035627797